MPDVYDICAMNPQGMRKGWEKHMLHFECDYACGAAQPVLDALVRTNGEQTSGYGEDLHCERARALIRSCAAGRTRQCISSRAARRPI